MSAPIIAFFSGRSGVGTTTLVYHLAWMYAELGLRVIAADLDPQADLTAAFFDDDGLEEIWSADHRSTMFTWVDPLVGGADVFPPVPRWYVDEEGRVRPLMGDPLLSGIEDRLSSAWRACLGGDVGACTATSAFWRVVQHAALADALDIILMDLGPNLSAINRAALISADYVVAPLSADRFALQWLPLVGPTLRGWREQWEHHVVRGLSPDVELPTGAMKPIGYVVVQHSARPERAAGSHGQWSARLPAAYREAMLAEPVDEKVSITDDPHCIAIIRGYHSLMPMAQEAGKPMFHLKPADGAIGAHGQAAKSAYQDFHFLASEIANRAGVELP